MRTQLLVLVAALTLGFVPAQAQQRPSSQSSAKSSFSLESGEACSGISTAECCEQKIEMAGLRTQGDYLARMIKITVQLACRDQERVVTPQVCRSIATSRGFSPKEVDAVCKPAARECKKDGACKQCVEDLARLDYHGSQHVCHAVTYVKDRSAKVVVLRDSQGVADSDTRFEITRRRTKLR